jgi:GTP-binding protein
VDEQLAMLVQKSHKPVVIVVNKWDLAEGRSGPTGKPVKPESYEKYIRKELKGLHFAPIALMSAKEGLNLEGVIDLAFEMHEQSGERVTTGKLNRLVRGILEQRGPSSKLGTFVKIFYVSQVRAHPPTILMVVNHPELFTDQYERYLLNRFRDELPFKEVPIDLVIRGRKQREREEDFALPEEAAAVIERIEAGEDVDALFEGAIGAEDGEET